MTYGVVILAETDSDDGLYIISNLSRLKLPSSWLDVRRKRFAEKGAW